jgi:hypothetical protein
VSWNANAKSSSDASNIAFEGLLTVKDSSQWLI